MPVEGLPDAAIHRLCSRCHKWHEPDEGVMVWPDRFHWIRELRQVADAIGGDTSEMRFLCYRCLRVRRLTTRIIWSVFFVVAAAALLIGYLT
jgi:hypothetical protein